MPRDVWKIGRIDSLCNSSDGKVRAAEVCLPNGRHIKRAINHLYPLEVADENLKFKEVTSKMNYDSNDSFIQRAIFIFYLPSVMEHELIYYIMYINVHYLKCVCINCCFIIMNQSPESSET